MFGYTADEMIGTSILRVIPQERLSEEDFVLGRIRAGLGVDHFETQRQRKDGTLVDISLSVSPIRDAQGIVIGASKIARDVSEQRRLRRELQEAGRAKDEFLAMLGHELRNPLAPILTALYLMELRGVGGEHERAVIERQVRHVIALVDDLLDVSRITRGALELRRRDVHLADIVAEGLALASPLLERRSHRLHVNVPRSDDLRVYGDADRLTQVIGNLLTNAAKYTPEGGDVWIDAWAADSGRVCITVRDNGVGIPADVQPRIFELFTRDRATESQSAGLGIGLAIVKRLVELHNGTVTVKSAGRGQGATFEVCLPPAALEAAAYPAPSGPEIAQASQPHRILVVDDNEDAARTLVEVLRVLGHTVQMALDPPSAIRLAREFQPEVALLDLGLPVMDGYELSRELRALPGLTALRVIAITGYGQASDAVRSTAAGFEAHLTKPVDPRDLGSILSRRRAH
jgi:PAS domain S-box-containing protein